MKNLFSEFVYKLMNDLRVSAEAVASMKNIFASPVYKLNVTEEGFTRLIDGEMVISVKWIDVAQIATYKVDLFAVDQICLGFFFELQDLQADIWNNMVEITEEYDGFTELCSMMEKQFPSIDKEWYTKVAFPAFETNLMLLYRR